MALGAGFAATTLFVGALATAKIPLAARLGWRLGGARLALPFAALVAVPGWGVYESLQLTHTAVLQSLAIAAMLPLLTLWRDGRVVTPASATNAGALYRPDAGSATHAWRVRFTACDATAASVVTLPMRTAR